MRPDGRHGVTEHFVSRVSVCLLLLQFLQVRAPRGEGSKCLPVFYLEYHKQAKKPYRVCDRSDDDLKSKIMLIQISINSQKKVCRPTCLRERNETFFKTGSESDHFVSLYKVGQPVKSSTTIKKKS